MSKIVVEVGEQMDGATFQLSPQTRAVLKSQQVSLPPATSLFVSNETRQDFERIYGPMSAQIVMILTGLPEKEVRELGFSFVSPVDSTVLLESSAA